MKVEFAEITYPSSVTQPKSSSQSELESVYERVIYQISYARERHPPMKSEFEAYTIIREEMEEFFDSVKQNEPDLSELYQVVACCLMALEDVYGWDKFTFNRSTNTGWAKVGENPTIYHMYGVGQYYFDMYWDDVRGNQSKSHQERDLMLMAQYIFDGLVFFLCDLRVRWGLGMNRRTNWENKFYFENL